jgi:FkbM family methyltransferase
MESWVLKQFLERRFAGTVARRRERQRNGPYPSHKRLILGLAELRDRIGVTQPAPVRLFLQACMAELATSRSQIFQDVFVLHVLGRDRPGFFVDFGATDGVSLSNSNLLETAHGWRGICAEPARNWHAALQANRPGATIETRCVWTKTGATLTFREAAEKELSTIDSFSDGDSHARKRQDGQTYNVTTVSLNDMLADHGAPAPFDYLSIDTEGSEFEILQAFDLARYMPRVITVEHNYTPRRRDIHALLTAAGYRRVLTEVSLFDDWYLAPGVALPGE